VLVAERDLSPRGDHFFDMLEELRRSTGGADFVRPLSRPTSWAGREDARLAAKGIAVSCEDVQIASVAAVRGLTLVSTDAAFSRFERLAVTDWAREGRARG
jgi:predicted nucleic acid-binding protein